MYITSVHALVKLNIAITFLDHKKLTVDILLSIKPLPPATFSYNLVMFCPVAIKIWHEIWLCNFKNIFLEFSFCISCVSIH